MRFFWKLSLTGDAGRCEKPSDAIGTFRRGPSCDVASVEADTVPGEWASHLAWSGSLARDLLGLNSAPLPNLGGQQDVQPAQTEVDCVPPTGRLHAGLLLLRFADTSDLSRLGSESTQVASQKLKLTTYSMLVAFSSAGATNNDTRSFRQRFRLVSWQQPSYTSRESQADRGMTGSCGRALCIGLSRCIASVDSRNGVLSTCIAPRLATRGKQRAVPYYHLPQPERDVILYLSLLWSGLGFLDTIIASSCRDDGDG